MILKSQVTVETPGDRIFLFDGIESTIVRDGHLILLDQGGERALFAPGSWLIARRDPFPTLEAE